MSNTQNESGVYVQQIRAILDEYSKLSKEQRIEKFISTIYKNGDGKRKYFMNIIDLIKFQQQGGIVINKNVINGYY